MAPTSRPVLILGMHRSGTSFLASVLGAVGVHLGEELLAPDRGNPRGYHEDRELVAYHDALLRARLPSSQGHGAFLVSPGFRAELTDEERGRAAKLVEGREGLWGWKDPRTALFLDHWLEVLPNARCVAVYRHPIEVYFSFLKRRDWSALLAPEAIFEAFAAYNEGILRAHAAAPDRFLVLHASRAFTDVPALARTLADFLGAPAKVPADLPHFAAGEFSDLGITEEQHRLMAVVHPTAGAAYDALQVVADEPDEFSTDGTRTVLPPALINLVSATLETRDEELAEAAVAAVAAAGDMPLDDDAPEPAINGSRAPLAEDHAGVHGLVETLCLNVPPATIHQLKAAIVEEIESEHGRLGKERDHYLGLYNEFFPLYENYFKAWKGSENTLEATRRWIADELMPLVRKADDSEGRRQQAISLARQMLDAEAGPLTRANVVRRHLALPNEEIPFNELLRLEGRQRALGATSFEEQLYAEWVAANTDLSAGSIVDLGSWLGSFAVSLALGVERNPTAAARVQAGETLIHAYDLFEWHASFEGWVQGTPHAGKYQVGDDFRDAFAHEIRDHAALIETHKADLTKSRWEGGEIRLLVNDAWKQLAIADSVVRAYFPHLRPGALLLHQDYLWCTESFIHVVMYRLRDWFEPVFQVPNGTTCAFICKRPVSDPPPLPRSYDDISVEEIDDAFLWSAGFVDALGKQVLPLGQAWLLAQKGETARAKEVALPVLRTRDSGHGFVAWQVEGFKSAGLADLLEHDPK